MDIPNIMRRTLAFYLFIMITSMINMMSDSDTVLLIVNIVMFGISVILFFYLMKDYYLIVE